MRFDTMEDLRQELAVPTDKRLFAIAQAMHEKSLSVEEIHDITKIDHWFLRRLESIVQTWDRVKEHTMESLPSGLLREAKEKGYSDGPARRSPCAPSGTACARRRG